METNEKKTQNVGLFMLNCNIGEAHSVHKFNKPVLLMASPVYTWWRKQYMVEETIHGRGNNIW